MFLLVAAATDSTGRTITLLTAGLIIVAIALAVLTAWYWRFTSPRSHSAPDPPLQPPDSLSTVVQSSSAGPFADPSPTPDPSPTGPSTSEHSRVETHAGEVLDPDPDPHPSPAAVVAGAVTSDVGIPQLTWPDGEPPEQIQGAESADAPLGLDGDQWAVLTQAVFDQFMGETDNET